MILNVVAVLCGTLLSAYDFLKSSFSNLQDTLPAEYRYLSFCSYLFVSISLYLSLTPNPSLSIYISLSISVSLSLSLYLSISLSPYTDLSFSPQISLYLLIPIYFRHELLPADAVSALHAVLSNMSDIELIDDAQDQVGLTEPLVLLHSLYPSLPLYLYS